MLVLLVIKTGDADYGAHTKKQKVGERKCFQKHPVDKIIQALLSNISPGTTLCSKHPTLEMPLSDQRMRFD